MSNNIHHIDFSDLQIVGRNHEIQQLQSAFDKICDTKACGVALVHGVSGTGKSLLVQTALQKLPKARFCSGKFDPHGISQPYSAIVEALSDLCDQIQHDEHIQAALKSRLGVSSSMVLPEMIPAVAELMGWSRSSRSFGSSVLDRHEWKSKQVKKELKIFLQVVCHPSTPCIIFIDDLQWADRASLELLHFMICNGQVQGLFFCGAFRDNEIDSSFPFATELQGNNNVTMIHVEELTLESINELIAGLFKCGVSAQTFELSQIVMKRTHGNAFYVIQFLRCLQGEGCFKYSASTGHFEWDLAKIQSRTSPSDHVIAFMQQKLERLPIETREVLKVAACFGSRFDDQIVDQLCGGCSETSSRLQVAIDEGLVAKRRRSSGFKFAHDQIQRAAYLQIANGPERLEIHLKIGRLLKSKFDKGEDQFLFIAAEQLNKGSNLILDEKEKEALAWLNLKAAQSAFAKSAFLMASTFLRFGLALIDDATKWTKSYKYTLQSMTMLLQMEYCIGDRDTSRLHIEEVLSNCKTIDEMLPAYIMKMESYAAEGFEDKAIDVGFDAMRMLGEPIPKRLNLLNLMIEYKWTKRMLKGQSDEDLLALPEMTDGRKLMALKIMSLLGGYAYTANQPVRIVMLGLREMRLTLRSGLSKFSAEAFATYGILAGQIGDFQLAFRFGNLAQTLATRYKSRHHNARSILAVHYFLWHLRRPVQESIEPLLKAHRLSMENGDIRNAAFSFFSYIYCYISCGLPLDPVVQDTKRFRKELGDHAQDLMYKLTSVAYQTMLNLTSGECGDPLTLTGSAMDEESMLHEASTNKYGIVAQNIYLQKAILGNYFTDFKLAGAMAEKIWKQEKQLVKGCNFATGVTYFVLGLSALGMRRVHGGGRTYQRRSRTYSRKYIHRLKLWVKQGEPNILHMYLILLAEDASLTSGTTVEHVKKAFDDAITSAVRSGFLQNAALAEERCALYFLNVGDEDYAEDYLRRSYAHYEEWGCKAKLIQLEGTYDFLTSTSSSSHSGKRKSTWRFGIARYDAKISERHRVISAPSWEESFDDCASSHDD